MRGAVYLSDINGSLQIDPRLLRLDPSVGQAPSSGFASSEYARLIPSGKCSLCGPTGDYLEITASEATSNFIVRVLDVVTVKISCDSWDVRSRIPRPRIHLLADFSSSQVLEKVDGDIAAKREITSSSLKTSNIKNGDGTKEACLPESIVVSIYREIQSLETPPVLSDSLLETVTKQKRQPVDCQKTITGRLIFGDFKNPDTKSAIQEASIEEAAESAQQRRKQAMASRERNNEFNTTQRIEKDATARMQRLQANKRNARKSKGK